VGINALFSITPLSFLLSHRPVQASSLLSLPPSPAPSPAAPPQTPPPSMTPDSSSCHRPTLPPCSARSVTISSHSGQKVKSSSGRKRNQSCPNDFVFKKKKYMKSIGWRSTLPLMMTYLFYKNKLDGLYFTN